MFRIGAFFEVFVRFIWLLLLWALASAASAQEFGRLYANSISIKLAQPLEWVAVPRGSVLNPEMLDRDPQAWKFAPYLRSTSLPTNDKQEVWVRFSLPITEMPQTWFVRVPRLTVWRVDLFFRNEQERWVSQSAGDSIAPAQWALRTRSPSFEIQSRTDKVQSYFMRFDHRNAITEIPLLIAPIEYVDGASRVGIVLGLLWGLFGLLVVLSAVAYRLLRNTIFLLFGGFVLSMLLTQLVLMGYGNWRLWPNSLYLSQNMSWIAPALSLALGIWFIAKASYSRDNHPWIYRMLAALAIGSLVLMAVAATGSEFLSRDMRSAWVAVATLLSLGALAWTAWRGRDGNGKLLLGFGIIGLAVMARLSYNFGWSPHAEFAQAAGIFAFSLGLLWIFLVLTWRSRASLVAAERAAALDSFDAATGLLHARIGQVRLPLLLQRGARFESGCGVIMLRWVNFEQVVAKLNPEARGAALTRIGLILRRLARDLDSVVRHGEHDFLILVEGPVAREALLSLCGKVLTECMRSSEKAGMANLFDLHIAVWQASNATASAKEVMEALQTRLSQMGHGTQRRVQLVDAAVSEPHEETEWEFNARKEDVIAKINAIEASPIVPTVLITPRKPREASSVTGDREAPNADSNFSGPASRPASKPGSR